MMLGLEEVPLSSVQKGQRIYVGSCTACHGQDAKGVIGLGKTLINSAFVNQLSDAELVQFIVVGRTGFDPLNTTGQAMPSKGGNLSLSDDDLLNLVHYVRSLNGATVVNDLEGLPTPTPIVARQFQPINVGGLGTTNNVTPEPEATPEATVAP